VQPCADLDCGAPAALAGVQPNCTAERRPCVMVFARLPIIAYSRAALTDGGL
jgi:hypothetical protein